MRSLFTFVLVALPAFSAGTEQALPLFFVPNAGQMPEPVRFLVQTPALRAGFSAGEAVFQIEGRQVRIEFAGASREIQPIGVNPLPGHAHFLKGSDPTGWHTDLATYSGLVYRQLYPGIDLFYAGSDSPGHPIKSEYRVAPGSDAARIRFRYPEADRVWVDGDGTLVVEAEGGILREAPPLVYQDAADGSRRVIPASYRIEPGKQVGFDLGSYDPALELVVDPDISYSTYLGGSGAGAVTSVAVDAGGNLYAAGWTEALDFPIAGAYQAINKGGVDAFVVKLNPAGNALVYATYIGGASDDRAAGIAVDSSGQAYVAGGTSSSNFPLMAAVRSQMQGGKEAFALKLNISGSALIYSTFLGGTNYEVANSITIDNNRNAYITGDTRSANFTILNAVQSSFGGVGDAFLTKLTTAGALVMSTFLGGSQDDHGYDVAVNAAGEAHVVGSTMSSNYPVAAPLQGASGGGMDAFVTKIATAATPAIVYSTYLGGSLGSASAPEQATSVAVDFSNNVYITGVTVSTNFPVTGGAMQTGFNGSRDAFVTKINAAGTIRVYSTYLGTAGFDWANAIAVNPSGQAYVAGYTSSSSFPSVNGLQSGFRGLYDGFVAQLSVAGNGLVFSTLYGGSEADQVSAIAVDSNGNMFVGGQTASFDLPLAGAIQSNNVGGAISWLARLGVTAPPSSPPTADSVTRTGTAGSAQTFTATYSNASGASNLTQVSLLIGTSAGLDFSCYVTYTPGGNLTLANNVASSGGTSIAPGSGTAANTQCTLHGEGSSAVTAGNTLTLTLSMTLETGFPGNDTVYLRGATSSANTGWVAFSVQSALGLDSVTPGAGTGAGGIFTFVFSDTQSHTNIAVMALLFNTTPVTVNGCHIVYDRNVSVVSLLSDDGTGAGHKPAGSSANLQNSQCAIGFVNGTASGKKFIIEIEVVFKGTFSGPKNAYMIAANTTSNTGWVKRGTYTVLAGGVPGADSVTPATGTGTSQTFTFNISEPGGSDFLVAAAMLLAPTLNTTNACWLVWDRSANSIALVFDSGSGAGQLPLGSSGSVGNSQCTLHGTGTAVSIGATTISITVNLSFSATFGGTKNVFLYAAEANINTGWKVVGTYTVDSGPPSVVSVSPASGSGDFPTFTATIADAASQQNLTRIDLLVSTGGTANACWVVANRITGTIGLYNDAGTVLNTKPLGSSANLFNSQCAIGTSSMNATATQLSVTVGVFFPNQAFAGLKNLYVEGFSAGSSSGRELKGTWTVPNSGPPVATSITPGSGSGVFPTFVARVDDTLAGTNISRISMVVTPSSFFNACYVEYNKSDGTIGLWNDGVTVLSTKLLGTSDTLENSQCAVGGSAVSYSGTQATLTVQILFKSPAFAGTKTMYLRGDTAAADSGWVAKGSWIVP